MKSKFKSSPKAYYWYCHIRDWRQSGLSRTAYCIEHGLSRYAFYYWFKRLDPVRQCQNANRIVPTDLIIREAEPKSYQPLRLCINDRYQLEIPGDFEASVLAKLIRTLEDIR